ncbi:MAG TPA: histidinol-phosphatase [Lachnospiraceae bacterium]|nr:histidinol-phosphatase [Lachnospiraceae bacterium]
MRINYHTHTSRCLHAQGSEEDYVLSAIHANIEVLGFSDHAPFPDKDYGLRMPYDQLKAYLNTLDSLSDKYAENIKVVKGLEIEYLPEYNQYYEDLLTKEGLQYLLLGEHFFSSTSGFFNIYNAISTDIYIEYANAVASAMETQYFKMVAHPDLFLLNPFAWDRNCEAACEIIINAAIKTNTILEFNANGFRRGKKVYPDGTRYQYPHRTFWKKISSANIPVIIGSDCHNPSQIWDDTVENAYRELNEYGISPITML